MLDILEFLSSPAILDDGASEEQLCNKFPMLTKVDLASYLNELLQSGQIELINGNNEVYYKVIQNRALDYEAMIIALLAKTGSTGMWLRDIKVKTNIPHNLVLKILKTLETGRKIKSVKSIKNNRRMYMLYDVRPAEEVTGGVWFNNNDVDLVFVNKLMEIIYKFCDKRDEPFALNKIESLTKISELRDFIVNSGITEVELNMNDLGTLVDCLVSDGRVEKYNTDDGVVIRCLRPDYLKY